MKDKSPPGIPLLEQQLREHVRAHGDDLDAQAVNFNLFRTGTDVLAAMEGKALRPLGLTHAGFVILMTLWITGPRETRELARVQRVSKPAIVSAVDTLVRSHLVERVRSETDRRLVSVRLTRAGVRLVTRAHERWHREERRTAAVLTRTEQRTLARLLRKLRTTIHASELEALA
jgi:MarR family 2-MHQ and catechol resistance regulon transcriptional repressor